MQLCLMQQWPITTKFVAAFAVWGCCALGANVSLAQSVPANPLRSAVRSAELTRPAKTIQQVQATEPPPPLQLSPSQPELRPQPIPRESASVLAPDPMQYAEGDPNLGWPAEAPAQQHYGTGQGFGHPPREPWFSHDNPNDPARHTGWGDPLTGTSWLNRPWYWGVFIGGMLADDLVAGHVEADSAPILGMRLGHDFDHFWGWESRYAYARTELFTGAGVPIVEPGRDYFVDVALLYYPWGDSAWRPYLLAGVGFANFRYVNDLGRAIDDTALTIPLGFGLKRYYSPWFTLRFDAVDNWSLSGGHLDSMHNFSLMAGVEFRFGGRRPSYFPWHGNTSYW